MVLFKDLNKTASDLIVRDFPHTAPVSVELKSTAAPLSLTAQATRDETGDNTANVTASYSSGNVKGTVKLGSNGYNLIEGVYALPKDYRVTGLSVFARRETVKGEPTLEAGAEWFAPRCHSRFSFFPAKKTFLASTLFGVSDNASRLGGELTGNIDGSDLKYSVGSSWTCTNRGVALSVKTLPAPLGLPETFQVSSHIRKADIDFVVDSTIKNDLSATFGIGLGRAISPDMVYKVRFADGKGALAVTQRLSNNTSVQIGVEHDGDKPKIGTKFFFVQ